MSIQLRCTDCTDSPVQSSSAQLSSAQLSSVQFSSVQFSSVQFVSFRCVRALRCRHALCWQVCGRTSSSRGSHAPTALCLVCSGRSGRMHLFSFLHNSVE